MSEITIKPISVNDIQTAENIDVLLEAYALESALDGMPPPQPDWATYRALEYNPGFIAFGAYSDDLLVGIMVVLVAYVAQYSATIGSTLAFFVLSDYRKFGTGKHLVERATEETFHRGATAIGIGAPSESRLAKAAESFGFKETNRLYLRMRP